MLVQHSVFHALLKLLPWGRFDAAVARHGADARVRRLPTRHHLIALLYAQLAAAVSLREIVIALKSHQAGLRLLGAGPVSRSTLADANARRPVSVFSDVFDGLLAQAHRGLRRRIGEAVYLIDATSLRLSALSQDWARFSKTACGAKVHVIYDPDADHPIHAVVTKAKVNDITPAKAMPLAPGATYVFDLGSYDFGWWARLDAAGCRFVTRLKTNTPLAVVAETPPPDGSTLLCDRIGHLPARQAASRRTPFQAPVREIQVRIETGLVLRLVTNDLDAPAQAIADLYKRRWAIELFFRWVKQVLGIKHMLGTSENAVRIQVAVALIAFLLLRLAQAAHHVIESPLAFARLIRSNLMHVRAIAHLIPQQPPPNAPHQLSLNLTFT